ncbi:MAG: MlaD family protein [Bacteroidota bacterium]|nr:MlaD family protein [Bacteroidota bacterium]
MKVSKEVKVGLLVTGALVALIWGMNYLKGLDLFSSDNKYYAVYHNVDGLGPSSEVILNGVKVGQVQKIRFLEDRSGRIEVTLLVNQKVFVGNKSVARIASSDLLGGRVVNLILDTNSPAAVDGDTLTPEVETTLSDQMRPIKDKAESLIESLDSLSRALQGFLNPNNQGSLNEGFASLSKTLKNLEQASGSLDKMLSSNDSKLRRMIDNIESISANIKNNNESLSLALKNIATITDSLAKSNLTSTINNANYTLKETSQIMEKINKGEGTMGMLINNDSLYNALERSASDLDKLLIDLKANPKRYVHISVFGRKSK